MHRTDQGTYNGQDVDILLVLQQLKQLQARRLQVFCSCWCGRPEARKQKFFFNSLYAMLKVGFSWQRQNKVLLSLTLAGLTRDVAHGSSCDFLEFVFEKGLVLCG